MLTPATFYIQKGSPFRVVLQPFSIGDKFSRWNVRCVLPAGFGFGGGWCDAFDQPGGWITLSLMACASFSDNDCFPLVNIFFILDIKNAPVYVHFRIHISLNLNSYCVSTSLWISIRCNYSFNLSLLFRCVTGQPQPWPTSAATMNNQLPCTRRLVMLRINRGVNCFVEITTSQQSNNCKTELQREIRCLWSFNR